MTSALLCRLSDLSDYITNTYELRNACHVNTYLIHVPMCMHAVFKPPFFYELQGSKSPCLFSNTSNTPVKRVSVIDLCRRLYLQEAGLKGYEGCLTSGET